MRLQPRFGSWAPVVISLFVLGNSVADSSTIVGGASGPGWVVLGVEPTASQSWRVEVTNSAVERPSQIGFVILSDEGTPWLVLDATALIPGEDLIYLSDGRARGPMRVELGWSPEEAAFVVALEFGPTSLFRVPPRVAIWRAGDFGSHEWRIDGAPAQVLAEGDAAFLYMAEDFLWIPTWLNVANRPIDEVVENRLFGHFATIGDEALCLSHAPVVRRACVSESQALLSWSGPGGNVTRPSNVSPFPFLGEPPGDYEFRVDARVDVGGHGFIVLGGADVAFPEWPAHGDP